MNATTKPPDVIGGDVAVAYVLVPFFIITLIGIIVAVVMYMRRKQSFSKSWFSKLTESIWLRLAVKTSTAKKRLHSLIGCKDADERIDRLRHQLLPVYTYDPSEDVNEGEQEMTWGDQDTKVGQGWMRTYQQRWPLLSKEA